MRSISKGLGRHRVIRLRTETVKRFKRERVAGIQPAARITVTTLEGEESPESIASAFFSEEVCYDPLALFSKSFEVQANALLRHSRPMKTWSIGKNKGRFCLFYLGDPIDKLDAAERVRIAFESTPQGQNHRWLIVRDDGSFDREAIESIEQYAEERGLQVLVIGIDQAGKKAEPEPVAEPEAVTKALDVEILEVPELVPASEVIEETVAF